MTRKIIIHSTFVQGDGLGDVIYFLHWLKSFSAYQGDAQQRVLIFCFDPNTISKFLLSLHRVEPRHPIFNFFKIDGKAIVPSSAGSVKNGFIGKNLNPFAPVDLKSFFADIAEDTNVTLLKISSPISKCFKDLQKRIEVENTFCILEFDGTPEHTKNPYYSTLGLERNDFGLLHDIDGITGLEKIEDYFQELTPALKKLIFQNENITITEAKTHLAEVPTVFVYLSALCDPAVLDAILKSPIIKTAVSAGKQPLFFITKNNGGLALPSSIIDACNQNKIRIVKEWLPSNEYKIINAMFTSRETNSIILPSGDNTITLCIKTGNFPLYVHKIPMADLMRPDFKYGIFRSMLKILDNSERKDWKDNPGFKDCKKMLTFLSKQIDKKLYNDMPDYITQPMLTFFRDLFAPYLMENFAFEKKTLPRLLNAIQQTEALLSKSKPMTVKFTDLKAKEEPAKNTKDEKNVTFGFKKGFLLN